jgi:transcriptional regulator with XRE-family HTH domain
MNTSPAPDQLRAARALLGLEQRAVARDAGISVATLRRVEAGVAPDDTTRRVADALHRAGVRFISHGVQLRKHAATAGDRAHRLDEILAQADAVPVIDPSVTEASLYGDDGLPR